MDCEPLLQQVLKNPDDLHSRQLLGGALREAGDPQGEYLRLACLLDQTAPDDPGRRELERRVCRLEREHFQQWSAPVRAIGPFGEPRLHYLTRLAFGRGLVEHLGGTGEEISGHLSAAAAVAPIRSIRVRPKDENEAAPSALAGCPTLSQVRRVEISALWRWNSGWALRLLEACAPLEQLAVTGLFGLELQEMMSLPALDRLERLELSDRAPPGKVGTIDHLATLQGVPLRRLELGSVDFGPGALCELAGHGSLTRLILDDVGGRQGGLQQLLDASDGPNLEELVLTDVRIPLPDTFLRAPALRGLRRLVCAAPAPDALVARLPAGLRELELAPTGFSLPALQRLASGEGLEELHHLRLVSPEPLPREGALVLGQARLPALRSLALGCVDEASVQGLANSPLLAGLERLTIEGREFPEPPPITESMVRALADSTNLRELRVVRHAITMQAVRFLLSEAWPRLECLAIERSGALAAGGDLSRVEGGPALEELALECSEPSSLPGLLRSPLAQRLRALALDCPVGSEHVRALCALPRLLELTTCNRVQPAARQGLYSRFGPQLTLPGPV